MGKVDDNGDGKAQDDYRYEYYDEEVSQGQDQPNPEENNQAEPS